MVLLRIVLLVLHTLHYAEGAKAGSSSKLNLGDATLLVVDGVADEGMKLAKEMLAKPDTNVNLEVEADDGSKGTPLAVAIHSMASPKAENCMELVHALLAHKDVDVNAALVAKDKSTMPMLVLAMRAVMASSPYGVDIAKALLAHEQIAVNAMTAGGAAKLAPLHIVLAAAARGAAGGLEVASLLLARSDLDVETEMVQPDGAKMSPLAKLATMLLEQPADANLQQAVALLHGRAKPLEDEKLKGAVEAAMAKKDEL